MGRRLKVVDMFAGSRSIGKVFESRGHDVFHIDYKPFPGIDLVADVEYLDPDDIPFKPDVFWCSPPCTTYSIAGIFHHRDNQIPRSDFAIKSDKVLKRMLWILEQYPDAIYYIENPVGMLRKMDFMKGLDRVAITYCTYGDNRMKPTDIWSNNIRDIFNPLGWQPRPKCFNGNTKCHHEPSPRGANTGTQGRGTNYKRSLIPPELGLEVCRATERKVLRW